MNALGDVPLVPRAPQAHRVRRGSGTGHEPQDRDDARGGAEALAIPYLF